MCRLVFRSGIIFFLLFSAYSFGGSKDDVLLIVHDREITKNEFLYHFHKNNQDVNKQNIAEYLELFINFQLKLVQAREERMHHNIGFINELTEYRLLLAAPYLTDKEKEQEFVLEASERLNFELNASHILVKIDPDVPPEDTITAYSKAILIRNRILDGEPFEQLALVISDDPMATKNSGNLGYFTAFQSEYPFETAAYNMKPGEISIPVRSHYGYHIILLNDKRKNLEKQKTGHEIINLISEAKDERTQMIEDSFVEKLKRDWSFAENLDALEIIYELADERVYKGNWIAPASRSFDETLFFIDGKRVYQKDFINFMGDFETLSRHLSIREYIFSLYQQFVSVRLIQYENYKLGEIYPEFRFQLQEYRDAMLLLAITRQKVWLKAESDMVLADYQDYLMKKWIKELRRTYIVQINDEVLSSLSIN